MLSCEENAFLPSFVVLPQSILGMPEHLSKIRPEQAIILSDPLFSSLHYGTFKMGLSEGLTPYLIVLP